MKTWKDRIKQQGEHGPPPIVAKALAAIAKTTRAELRRLEAAIAAKIKANPGFARRAEIVTSVPGLAGQTAAGVIAWLPELGRIRNEAAAALIGAAPYDDDSGGRKADATSRADAASSATSSCDAGHGKPPPRLAVLKAYYSAPARQGQGSRGSPSSPACAS